jgi:hypothetical protein
MRKQQHTTFMRIKTPVIPDRPNQQQCFVYCSNRYWVLASGVGGVDCSSDSVVFWYSKGFWVLAELIVSYCSGGCCWQWCLLQFCNGSRTTSLSHFLYRYFLPKSSQDAIQ